MNFWGKVLEKDFHFIYMYWIRLRCYIYKNNVLIKNVCDWNRSGLHILWSRLMNVESMHGEVLYGIHPTLFALTSDRRRIHKMYIRDSLMNSSRPFVDQLISVAREKSVPYETCSKALLDSLCQARPHQVRSLSGQPPSSTVSDRPAPIRYGLWRAPPPTSGTASLCPDPCQARPTIYSLFKPRSLNSKHPSHSLPLIWCLELIL